MGVKPELIYLPNSKEWVFLVIKRVKVLCYSYETLKLRFTTYDQCFRAARKWMRNNQNLVYGENNV
jgi:hypothetical protein